MSSDNDPVQLPNIRIFDQGSERRGQHGREEGPRGLVMVIDQGGRRIFVPLDRTYVMNMVAEFEAWLIGEGKFPSINELHIPIDTTDMTDHLMREAPGGLNVWNSSGRGSLGARAHGGKDSHTE